MWKGGPNFAHREGRGMKNKEHFKSRTMEFLLKSWSGESKTYRNLRGGRKFHQVYENVFHSFPTSKQEFTIPMAPEQNGVSERLYRTIMNTARSMLYHGKLPVSFWAETVATSV